MIRGMAAVLDKNYKIMFELFELDKHNFGLAFNISFERDYLSCSKEYQE